MVSNIWSGHTKRVGEITDFVLKWGKGFGTQAAHSRTPPPNFSESNQPTAPTTLPPGEYHSG